MEISFHYLNFMRDFVVYCCSMHLLPCTTQIAKNKIKFKTSFLKAMNIFTFITNFFLYQQKRKYLRSGANFVGSVFCMLKNVLRSMMYD